MCTPKTKIEREVDRLHRQMPKITERQKEWMNARLTGDNICTLRRKKYDVKHLCILTTKGGWQVLRHVYAYGHYVRGKRADTTFIEAMEQWFSKGRYVFYMRTRVPYSYCTDMWSWSSGMVLRRGSASSVCFGDPRDITQDDILIERVTDQFKYAIRHILSLDGLNVGYALRAINTDPIWETLLKKDYDTYKWCVDRGLTEDKRKTAAVRIAIRHKYDFKHLEWCDLLSMLLYLNKDYRNPHYICPADLTAMHDEISRQASEKRQRAYRRRMEQDEERRRRRMIEQIEQDKKAKENYGKVRGRFFGVLIEGKGLQIKCLQSVEEFVDEGQAMHHCVFSNAYYDTNKHPNSLILSARTTEGERVETIEVNIKDYTIEQSRGKYNACTDRHEDIIQLVNDNMSLIRKANKSRRKAV